MRHITSKEVKRYILNYNDLSIISTFLDIDYRQTVEGIFNSLFILVKNYDKNKSIIFSILDILKEQLNRDDIEELKMLIGPIINFQNKVSRLSVKERIKAKSVCVDVQDMFCKIHKSIDEYDKLKKLKCLEFLIFEDRNISMIWNFIRENEELFYKFKLPYEQIFLKILKRYFLSTDMGYKKYLYDVMIIFLRSNVGEVILSKKDEYLKLCQNHSSDKILRLFRDDLIDCCYADFSFPNVILNEIQNFHVKDVFRKNFTYQKCFTIDGDETKCFDDALYIEKRSDGSYNLYVHIADVASFVPFTSMTGKEASNRLETLYTHDKNFLLYPSAISDNISSLLVGSDRNTISYIFHLDCNFCLVENDFDIVPGRIRVDSNFNYRDIDALISTSSDYGYMLNYLSSFAYQMKSRGDKYVGGDVSFAKKIAMSDGEIIIHEAMVLVNYMVAKYFKEHSFPYVYRTLDVPSDSFLKERLEILKKMGCCMDEDKQFCSNLRDSYVRAVYCENPTYHCGLGLDCYSHSTSPLRRYVDSFGQYLIYDFLFFKNNDDEYYKTWENRIHDLVTNVNSKVKENESFLNEYHYLSSKCLIKEK